MCEEGRISRVSSVHGRGEGGIYEGMCSPFICQAIPLLLCREREGEGERERERERERGEGGSGGKRESVCMCAYVHAYIPRDSHIEQARNVKLVHYTVLDH